MTQSSPRRISTEPEKQLHHRPERLDQFKSFQPSFSEAETRQLTAALCLHGASHFLLAFPLINEPSENGHVGEKQTEK